MELVAGDIGGTHARFAIATVEDSGGPFTLSHLGKLKVADHATLQTAFEAWAASLGRPVPRAAGIAVAAPVGQHLIRMANNPWLIRPAMIASRLGMDHVTLVNDFAAVAHAIAVVGADGLAHVAGPAQPIADSRVVSVIGPGTGLGVAILFPGKPPRVVPTEGGHIDFAPLDSLEDRLLQPLRQQFRRVSVERIVSGPGLAAIHGALAAIEGRAVPPRDDAALWADAIAGTDPLAVAALDRWFLAFGAVAGDLALAHGSDAVVLAGGVTPRIADQFASSGFHARFVAKGRFEPRMQAIPVWRVTQAEPGLLGAAAAHLAQRETA
jgi:glucokinase